jgi:hypothetical protein
VFNDRGIAGIYLWIIGTPLLITIIMIRKEVRIDILMSNPNKFSNEN